MAAETSRDPGGRPKIGPAAKWALPAPLRAALAAARRTDPDGTTEPEAAAARRLLAVALDPALPAALRMAATAYDTYATGTCAECPDPVTPAPGRPCDYHAGMIARAVKLRQLADQLT